MRRIRYMVSTMALLFCLLLISCTSPIDEARKLAEQGSYDLAIERYDEIIKMQPNHFDVYAEMAEVLAKTGQKEQALNTIKNGISTIDHEDETSMREAFNVWWDILISNDSQQAETLSQKSIDGLKKHLDLIYYLDCFYFPEQLNNMKIMAICDSFCGMYYARDDYEEYAAEVQTIYPAKHIVKYRVVVLDETVVRNLLHDILGLSDYDLSAYYAELESKQIESDDLAEYNEYANRKDVYSYYAWDPDLRRFKIKDCFSLGDGYFYVIVEQGWYDDESAVLGDLHFVIREADNYFGFQLVSVLQNEDGNILLENWKVPN